MGSTNNDDDSAWEFEYDDNTTEDLYITLDLTTHVPPNLLHERASKHPRTARGSNKSLGNAPGLAHLPTLPSTNAPDGAPAQSRSQSQPPFANCMQIVDLASTNPIVSFNNTLYSCHWATDIGTSLYLTPPSSHQDSGAQHLPLRSTSSFDLLGTTCARLIAVPATLKPHAISNTALKPRSDHGAAITTAEGDIIHQSQADGLRIELPSTASASRVSQARFLEKLSAIKAQRGNLDAVPATNVKVYKFPENWEADREAWIAKETVLSEKNRLEAALRMANTPAWRVRMPKTAQDGGDTATSPPPLAEDGEEPPDTDADADADAEADAGAGAESEDADDAGYNKLILASQQSQRKRKTRGGARGGAPSGKRLRESLGLPEARRDRKAVGRPRQIVLDADVEDAFYRGVRNDGPAAAAAAPGSGSESMSVEPPGQDARMQQEQ